MDEQKLFRAAVIGCGRIGTIFGGRDDAVALSHAGVYHQHSRTELCGLLDTDPERLHLGATKWSAPAFNDVDQLMKIAKPEIVSVCVPTSQHVQCLEAIAPFQPAAVVCEKPLASTALETERVVSLFQRKGIPLFVNYSRRFDHAVLETRRAFDQGEFGKILNASIRYSKGLLHNGSHAVNLLHYLFGELITGRVFTETQDAIQNDPTISAWLSFQRCSDVHLIGGDERYYSIFEMDIVGERKRRVFDRFGLRVTDYIVREDPVYDGYRELTRNKPRPTGLEYALNTLVDHVVLHLETGEPIICSGSDALATQRLCERILSLRENALP